MKKILFFVVALTMFLTVALENTAQQIQVFNFDELLMPDTGFWNGADVSNYDGSFGDEFLTFPNNYNSDWDSWSEFAFSSWNDTITGGLSNQWSAFADSIFSDTTFGLAYISTDWNDASYPTIPIEIYFTNPVEIQSLRITNSTFTALAIKNGSYPATPFETGDYYKIFIYAIFENESIDTVEVLLSDYSNINDTVVIDEWLEVDLSSFDTITSLRFDAYSTDIGSYGINTPLYFCLDDIIYKTTSTSINYEIENNNFSIYPNPTKDFIIINENVDIVNIFDLTGRLVLISKEDKIDISYLPSGTYILQAKTDTNIKTTKFVKL